MLTDDFFARFAHAGCLRNAPGKGGPSRGVGKLSNSPRYNGLEVATPAGKWFRPRAISNSLTSA